MNKPIDTVTPDLLDAEQPAAQLPAERPAAAPVALAGPATPMDLLQMVTQRGASLEEIGKFMELVERQQAKQAEQAFNAARAAFKAESITLTKDKENKQYKSMYTTIGNLVTTVTPYLSKHGLSADWKIDQTTVPGQITVKCILSHAQGHSDSVSFTVPPDEAGAKNPIQQLKSSITYAKAVTFESVCGLAATDANVDDDGNGAGDLKKLAAGMKPGAKAPAKPLIAGPRLASAIASIKAGDYTYDELATYYGLTPEQDAFTRLQLGMASAGDK